MKKTFVKMHGLGNDFAIFDGRKGQPIFWPAEKIRALGDRNTGVGFDQMVIIDPPKGPDAEVFMRIFNADGGEVGACGNATRCVGHLLMQETGRDVAVMQTVAGLLKATRAPQNAVTVDMGPARLKWQEIPLSAEEDTLSMSLTVGVLKNPVAVNVGNPHAVFFLQTLDDLPLEKLGPLVETHHSFPEKTNVEAVEVLSRKRIRMQVWERGVGITRACGTGACAAVVAAVRRDLTERNVTVELAGGLLDISWRESDGHVLMTGAVAEVYRAELAESFME
jgi:diaminopimelate epimerase